MDATNSALLRTIMEKKILDDSLKAQLADVIKQAKQQFVSRARSSSEISSWLLAFGSWL